MRTAWPSCTPAGVFTVKTRFLSCPPLPPQDRAGSRVTGPRPRQVGQGGTLRDKPAENILEHREDVGGFHVRIIVRRADPCVTVLVVTLPLDLIGEDFIRL